MHDGGGSGRDKVACAACDGYQRHHSMHLRTPIGSPAATPTCTVSREGTHLTSYVLAHTQSTANRPQHATTEAEVGAMINRCVSALRPKGRQLAARSSRRRRTAVVGLALRDLVVMVRELEVGAPRVEVDVLAEHGVDHRAALDVPPRPPEAPSALPRWLPRLGRLPQRKVLQRSTARVASQQRQHGTRAASLRRASSCGGLRHTYKLLRVYAIGL